MDDHARAIHPIEGGDLLAFVDGVASPEAAAHIASCPDCLAEVRALGGTAAMFGAALERFDCPEPDELLQYSIGFAERAGQERIRQHLAGCERCTAELAELNAIDSGAGRVIPELWGPVSLTTPPAGTRRLVARPVTAPARAAVRGEERRQLVFEAGEFQLVLSLLVPGIAEQGWRVEGQVAFSADGDPALAGASVALLADGTAVMSDTVDDLGYFVLEPVPAGQYALELHSGDESIAIDDLRLR